jgi:Ras-related protein Rab-5C
MYYRNVQVAVVMYDITKAASLEKAKMWVKELQRQANLNIVIVLTGNKIDLVRPSPSGSGSSATTKLEDKADDATATLGKTTTSDAKTENLHQVPHEEVQAYTQEAGLLFFETSAKMGEGMVEVFTEIGMSPPYFSRLIDSHSDSLRWSSKEHSH